MIIAGLLLFGRQNLGVSIETYGNAWVFCVFGDNRKRSAAVKTKYLFFDIDGTLIEHGAELQESVRDAIRLAKANGHQIIIASGRARCAIPSAIQALEYDGLIASAGAYVEYRGKSLFHQPMQKEEVASLVEFLEKHAVILVLETNDKCYLNETSFQNFREEIKREWYLEETEDQGRAGEFLHTMEIREDLKSVDSVNKVLYFKADAGLEELREQFGDYFTIIPNSVLNQEDAGSGEISEKGMHKAFGMEVLLQRLGIGPEDTIAFGDGWNDVEMLQQAGIGVAMGNAVDGLKAVADLVTGKVSENGIYQAFKQLRLI